MRHTMSVAAVIGLAAIAVTAQPQRHGLTGTVVAVNQQADTVTLIDLKAMQAYRHVPVRPWPCGWAVTAIAASPMIAATEMVWRIR